jgi:hypothetical protein
MRDSLDDVLPVSDTIVIGDTSGEFHTIQDRPRPNQAVGNLARALRGEEVPASRYHGIRW